MNSLIKNKHLQQIIIFQNLNIILKCNIWTESDNKNEKKNEL